MKNIQNIRLASLYIFLIPFVAVNICLFIVQSGSFEFSRSLSNIVEPLGKIRATFPYFDGGTSISRVARFYPTYWIFKPAMIITSIFLIYYWQKNYILFGKIDNSKNLKKYFKFFGVTSAIFLILHSIFLGIKFDYFAYKVFRRVVLLLFVIFEITAQCLLVINVIKVKKKINNLISKKILKLKIILVSTLVIVAIISIPLLISKNYVEFKHGLEWNYFVSILLFYLLTNRFWKKRK